MNKNQFKQIAIIWNSKQNSNLPQLLATKTNKLKKDNSSSQKDIHLRSWTVIKNEKEFNEIRDFNIFEKIIILAELDWKEGNLVELYGIDVLRRIRFQKKSIAKCILVSFFSLKKIKELRKYKDFGASEIIKTNFVQLPNINFLSIDYLNIKTLSNSTNAINLLKFFFEINHVYALYYMNHGQSLLGDLTKIQSRSFQNNSEEKDKLMKSIGNRIAFLIKCWNEIESNKMKLKWPSIKVSFHEIKSQFDEIKRADIAVGDLYNLINNLEGYFIKQMKNASDIKFFN